jgi:Carboxypeptidase regulatory-like domain
MNYGRLVTFRGSQFRRACRPLTIASERHHRSCGASAIKLNEEITEMPTTNNIHPSARRHFKAFLKARFVLLLIVSGVALFLVTRVSAQSTGAASTKTGSVQGTVVDVSGDPIPDATVILQAPTGNALTFVTTDDGAFALQDVEPGIAYQMTIIAKGFGESKSTVTIEPGQSKIVTEVALRPAAVERAVTVGYSSKEVAQQQVKAEEQQRVLRFLPNIYVTYDPHPEPLTSKMKFHLMYKGLTHPSFFALEAAWAGIQYGANTPNWPHDGKGYAERFGANLAGGASEMLFSNAILPSLLHQDPRYFYQGAGGKGSRAWHAILAPIVCKGDNGNWEPNYSQMGGLLISASLSNAYYPASNRGPGLVARNFGTNMGIHVALGLAQEFILAKFTSRGKQH